MLRLRGSWGSRDSTIERVSRRIAFDGEMPPADRLPHHGGPTARALVLDSTVRIPVAVHKCAANQTRHNLRPFSCFVSPHISYCSTSFLHDDASFMGSFVRMWILYSRICGLSSRLRNFVLYFWGLISAWEKASRNCCEPVRLASIFWELFC